MKSYRKARKDGERNAETSTQAPMILERRERPSITETAKPTLYDPHSPKNGVRVLRSAQQTEQLQKSPRYIARKQATPLSPSSKTEPQAPVSASTQQQQVIPISSYIPFFRRNEQFNLEGITKALTDNPGHFVVGVIGQQGVGKSTLLSSFTERPTDAFPSQPNNLFLSHGHKTSGIDMHICPERMILLDTEPIMCWTVLEKALRHHSTDGLLPDMWLEMDALYNLVFMLSVCNVVIVVSAGTNLDMDLMHCLQRAEMLKFQLPDFPLIPPGNFGQAHHDMNYYPDIVFVCNKCQSDDFTRIRFESVITVLQNSFGKSQLQIRGVGSLGKILPAYKQSNNDRENLNLYFLPYNSQLVSSSTIPTGQVKWTESFELLVTNLRDHIMAAPRRTGKKGQISEREWFRNAVKLYELVRNSEYIADYLKNMRKLRDG
ncbi:hypothetical protein BCR42DRAFT_403419 [Absidia repens]|uniref:Protein SMG9 n=1 Tax=Absidia repens TaxID=90262 RepID=A0A1X2IZE5_9FUNG|nr:hypothetical protein BCR42DRAFT_403419 [Absidia repens]